MPSAENESDGLTREDVNNDVRLSERVFRQVDNWYGPLQSDLMASSANVQRDRSGKSLPFCSRYYDKGCLAVDALSIDVRCFPRQDHSGAKMLNYCFPPEPMIAQFLNHLRSCRANCVVIVPSICSHWFATFSEGLVHQSKIARKGQAGVFVRFHKNRLASYRPRHDMVAALLDFN